MWQTLGSTGLALSSQHGHKWKTWNVDDQGLEDIQRELRAQRERTAHVPAGPIHPRAPTIADADARAVCGEWAIHQDQPV